MTESSEARIRVLIIDDHRMFADAVSRLLSDEDDLEVVGIATDGQDGISLAAALSPNVVLVDYSLPGLDGVAVTVAIKSQSPSTYVVMLTGSPDDRVLLRAIEAGCSGYLSKVSAADQVVEAVRLAAVGEALISPKELARVLPKLGRHRHELGGDLTERERQILVLLAAGRTNPEIAGEIHLSVNTVRNHVQGILTKVGAHSKLEAVSVSVRAGIIDYPGSVSPRS
jgi:DNA-binding NarL/FixJ family response regulator